MIEVVCRVVSHSDPLHGERRKWHSIVTEPTPRDQPFGSQLARHAPRLHATDQTSPTHLTDPTSPTSLTHPASAASFRRADHVGVTVNDPLAISVPAQNR